MQRLSLKKLNNKKPPKGAFFKELRMRRIWILFVLICFSGGILYAATTVDSEANTVPKSQMATNSTAAPYEPDFTVYMKDLQKNIKKNWAPPRFSKSNSAVLLFKINKDGSLGDCKLFKSSGDSEFDKAALDAVHKTAPFKPLVAGFKGESVDVQFTFDYNLYDYRNAVPAVEVTTYVASKSKVYSKITENSPSKLTEKSLKKEDKKEFNLYMKQVTEMLDRIEYSGGKQSLVKIKFTIDKQGKVTNPKVSASTGNKEFNNNILEQLKLMEFGEIPLKLQNIPVEYQFDNYVYTNTGTTKHVMTTAGYINGNSAANTAANTVSAGSLLGLFILKLTGR